MSEPARTLLRDGSSVLIRPLGPADRELLRSGFEHLSDRARYLRFQTPLTELSDDQLTYLTAVDHHDHEALVALDPDSGDAVGVARFVRVDDHVAECAIVVADDWQNRGVATQLLEALVERARAEEIDRFTALVLADNAEALSLFRRLGDTVHQTLGSQMELEITLPPAHQQSPQLRLILAGAARGLLIPAISMWRQVADFAHHRRRAEAVLEPANVIVAHAYATGGDAPALSVAAELAAVWNARIHLVESY